MRKLEATTPGGGVGWAVARYALSGFAALVILAAAGVYLLQHIGRTEAIRHAQQLTELAGRGIVEPHLTPSLEYGSPRAIQALDAVVRKSLLGSSVVRIKVWLPDGRIVYSDQHRLIGLRYSLGADETGALRAGVTKAEISDLRRPENRFERRFGKLLEVYLPIRDRVGRKLLFEDYERYSSVAASGRHLWLSFAPAVLGVLALLWLVQLPLAWRAARGLERGRAERERLLRHAIDASESERRRIARDLHDGAVQDLAGVSYSLAATAANAPADVAAIMMEVADDTRRAIKQLRTLLVDIYPPDLPGTGLEVALRDLLGTLAPRGISASIEAPPTLELPEDVEALFYRCAQEALRNVVKHSNASAVVVRVEANGVARLAVDDDGVGLPRGGLSAHGHLGLRLLRDLAREAGGTFRIESSRSGTRISVEVPV